MSSEGMSKMVRIKMEEGEKMMKEGDKLTRKTVFRWNPDWEGASLIYEKAANCFKGAKNNEKAITAFQKTSTCLYNSGVFFGAAKNLEAAASLSTGDNAAEYYIKASQIYSEEGKMECAAEALVKAAGCHSDFDNSIELFSSAFDMFEAEEKEHLAGNAHKSCVDSLLKKKKVEEAIPFFERRITGLRRIGKKPHEVHKLILSVIVLHLHCDDFVGAERTLNSGINEDNPQMDSMSSVPQQGPFSRSSEAAAADDLIRAFDSGSSEQVQEVVSRQLFTFLDNEVARLALDLPSSPSLKAGSDEEEGLA